MEKMIPAEDRKVSIMVRLKWTASTSSLTLTPSYGTPTVHRKTRIIYFKTKTGMGF